MRREWRERCGDRWVEDARGDAACTIRRRRGMEQ